jgi:hypothetical protein
MLSLSVSTNVKVVERYQGHRQTEKALYHEHKLHKQLMRKKYYI